MGTMQKVTHKLGKLAGVTYKTEKKITISDPDKCLKCGKCSRGRSKQNTVKRLNRSITTYLSSCDTPVFLWMKIKDNWIK